MNERDKCDDSFARADITLQEPLHTDIFFHIFEDFKESDFLMTGECKRELLKSIFDKISIKWYSLHMTDTGFLDDFLSLKGAVLEFEEFFVGEFMFREFIGLKGLWGVECLDISDTRPMFTDILYSLWEDLRYVFEVFKQERYLLTEPLGIDALNLRVYREICLSLLVKELDVRLRE